MNYRRKRIPGLPPDQTRALDDEFARLEQVTDYLSTLESAGGGDGVPETRAILTTNGLQGGGDLSADRTLSPIYGSTGNTVCQGNDARLSDARTPTAHTHVEANISDLNRMKWRGLWAAGSYAKNDVVRTARWLAVANKATSENPAPTQTVGRQPLYPTDPTWTQVTETTNWGFRVWSVATKTVIHGVRVRLPVVGDVSISTGNGTTAQRQITNGAIPTANVWTLFLIPPIVVQVGTVFDVFCNSTQHYKNDGFFAAEPNGRGIKFASYPPLGSEATTTRYGIDILYEQPTFPADWDYLDGY